MPQIADPKELAKLYLDAVLIAADAKTNEEKARVEWRFRDHIKLYQYKYGVAFADALSDLVKERNFPQPQSNSHWSDAEYDERFKESQKFFG
jgi:hypothetical protein